MECHDLYIYIQLYYIDIYNDILYRYIMVLYTIIYVYTYGMENGL